MSKGRIRAETFADHYSQAHQFYRSQTAVERAHIASAFVFELSKVQAQHVRDAMVGHLRNVDGDLARRVADGLGLKKFPPPQPAAVEREDRPVSPALQIVGKMKRTLKGRVVGILMQDGSDAGAVAALRKAVEEAGARATIVAPHVGGVKLSDGNPQAVDGQLAGTPSVLFDAVALILSEQAAAHLANESAAVDFVRDAYGHLKAIAFDTGARTLLHRAGIEDDAGVVDVTDLDAFIAAAMTRQWEREAKVRTLA